MIHLAPTIDMGPVAAVWGHAAVWPALRVDDGPERESLEQLLAALVAAPGGHRVLLARAECGDALGAVLLHPMPELGPWTWQAHIAVLPEYRGKDALAILRGAIEWLWMHTDARTVVGLPPVDNRAAQRLCAWAGAVRMGTIHGAYLKGGAAVDAAVYAITREVN